MFRKDFPILKSNLVYLDSAASAQKPNSVLNAMDVFYRTQYSNVHRGTCRLSSEATEAYENARQTVADFLHAKADDIIFTKGATEAINLVAEGYAKKLKAGDEVLVSIAEHHANFVPWQQACLRTGATLKVFNVLPDGRLDLDDFKSKLNKQTRIVAVSMMSNVLGVINPVHEIIPLAHQVGARVLLDAAQSIAHISTDVQQLDCDFLAFSGHKMYGPTGIGVLYGKTDALESLPPYQFGGEMVERVSIASTTFAPLPARLEAGTPPIAEAVGLSAAIKYILQIGFEQIQSKEHVVFDYLCTELKKVKGMKFVGNPEYKTGLVAFNIQNIHPNDLAILLSKENICSRVGHHCAMPLHSFLGISASLRVSLGLYNNQNDIDVFIRALNKARGFFE